MNRGEQHSGPADLQRVGLHSRFFIRKVGRVSVVVKPLFYNKNLVMTVLEWIAMLFIG